MPARSPKDKTSRTDATGPGRALARAKATRPRSPVKVRSVGAPATVIRGTTVAKARIDAPGFSREALNGLPTGVAMVDLQGRQSYVNDAFCRLVGRTRKALLGETAPFSYWAPLHVSEIKQLLNDVVYSEVKASRHEIMFRHRNGNEFPVSLHLSPVHSGGQPIGWVAVVVDISQQVEQRNALRLNEARFRAITEHVDEVFYVFDNDAQKITYISPSYERIWGRSCDSLYENPYSFLDAIREPGRQKMLGYLEGASRRETYRLEYEVERPDGSMAWISDQSYPLDFEGRFWTVGLAADMTERRSLELSLQHQRDILRRATDVAALGMWISDFHTGLSECNSRFYDILGYAPPADDPGGPPKRGRGTVPAFTARRWRAYANCCSAAPTRTRGNGCCAACSPANRAAPPTCSFACPTAAIATSRPSITWKPMPKAGRNG